MGIVQRFERKLEDVVGDAFARVFGGSIVPQEVQASLRREAADGVRSAGQGRLLAPNEFFVLLSTADHEKAADDRDLNPDTFAELLREYIRDQGWQTYGEVVVRFEQSPNLHTGQFRTRGVVNPDSKRDRPHGAVTTAPPTPDPQPGAPMTDNPGPQQGRPGEEYGREDDRYGRPDQDPRGQQPQGGQGYPRARVAMRAAATGRASSTARTMDAPRPATTRAATSSVPRSRAATTRADTVLRLRHRRAVATTDVRPPRRSRVAATVLRLSRAATASLRAPTTASTSRVAAMAAASTAANRAPSRPGLRASPAYPQQGGYGAPPQQGGYGPPQGGYGEPEYGDYEQGGYQSSPDYGAPAGGPGGGRTTVTLQLDDGSGRTYQLREGTNVIGRGQDAQFRLPDTGVSRRHLEVRFDGHAALLSDLNSTNGTTVNNAPVTEWQLADGDIIRLGHSEIIVRVQ
ncbi:FHA domain protein [Mycobacteroides abscessus MAB_082312_2258]|nr:FHA domain protein [Mycobacteroides abscessus MAB_082312_2258]